MLERDHTTEIYDLLCDLDFGVGVNRGDYIGDAIPEQNYTSGNIHYETSRKHWYVYLPLTNYEYSYVGFKAFKPISIESTTPNKIFYCCAQANNTSKRVAFDSSNLTDGIDFSPINQVTVLEFWVEDSIYKKTYSVSEVSKYYYNLILELDFYIRK